MPANRHRRRAAAARARPRARERSPRQRSFGERIVLGVAGVVLLALPLALLGTLHGHAVPRGLLLLPVVGIALIVLAVR